jgi:UDP-N-acetylglucosamine acyltransferase
MSVKIHPSAVVHPSARLDEHVEIGPYAVIGENVTIGAGTYIGPHCLAEYAEIGKNNQFTGGCYIGTAPQDYSYHGELTMLKMGDSNIVREGVSLHRGSPATKLTSIGSGCMFMANSHVGHDCRLGDKIVMVNSSAAAGHVHIGDKVIISGMVGIHQFSHIGTMSMLAGGAMVNQDIIPYVTAHGNRARPVALNLVGMRRNGFSREAVAAVKLVFKTLFHRGLTTAEAVKRLRGENLPPEAVVILDFCEDKSRRRPAIARPDRLASGAADSDE